MPLMAQFPGVIESHQHQRIISLILCGLLNGRYRYCWDNYTNKLNFLIYNSYCRCLLLIHIVAS